jgi:hypothetical protein
MDPPIPEDKRLLIKMKIYLTQESKEIEKNTEVSRRTIQRYRKNLLEYDIMRSPKTDPQDHPPIIISII